MAVSFDAAHDVKVSIILHKMNEWKNMIMKLSELVPILISRANYKTDVVFEQDRFVNNILNNLSTCRIYYSDAMPQDNNDARA